LAELKPNQPATEKYFNSKMMLHELGSDPAKDAIYLAAGSNPSIATNPHQIPVIVTVPGSKYSFAIVKYDVQNEVEIFAASSAELKPQTRKDFIACGEYLINEKYAAKNKLAAIGVSAGGITIGRAVTDRPDLFVAAFPVVGVLDMLRSESTANGASNIPEYGTVKDEVGFKALREMSTYDHIKNGTEYPAILLYHGYNDPRVDVWMSAKAGARLQAATTSGKPVLLDIDYESGHGIGNTSAQSIRRTTDLLSVMLWQLGDPEFQPAEKTESAKKE
jgi:prolyl oligopeptidase